MAKGAIGRDATRVQGPAAVAAFALVLLGCADPDDRPIGPGGGGGGPDNFVDAGWTGNVAYGRVCEVQSFSDRGPCKPLLNADLIVSTFSSGTELQADGSFSVRITHVAEEHVPVYVRSTDSWFGGTLAADAVEGEDLFDLEVPVMKREVVDAIVADSGEDFFFGNGIVAVQTTSFSGLPLDAITFGNLYGIEARYGGPSVYQPGAATTSDGTALYFDVDPGSSNFDVGFSDGGMDYTTHSIVAPDNFTIIPVLLSR